MSIESIVKLSHQYGGDEEYVLAGGGNTSYKKEGVLYVKGSGTALASIEAEQFVAMDMEKLQAMLKKDYPEDDAAREAAALADMMAARLPGEEKKRPSVEAILHALFPYTYVVHTHPALVNGLGCGKEGAAQCAALFGERATWIPLTKPGYILARVCEAALREGEARTGAYPRIVIIQNHGLFVAANAPEEIDELTDFVMGALRGKVRRTPDFSSVEFDAERACGFAPALRGLYGEKAIAVFTANRQASEFVRSEAAMEPLMRPFTPDHIVYCRHKPLFLKEPGEAKAAFAKYEEENGFPPKIVAVEGLGFFALGATKKEADIARKLFLDAMKIAVYAEAFGGYNALPDDYTDFILHWEIENYRQKVALSGGGSQRLLGKVAIVTGSAQGFGKGLAEAMAAQGAHVVVADMNEAGAKACADALCEAHGPGAALSVVADVANEESVKAMVRAAVLEYGGLDIMVSNAGVLIAGSLPEMSKEHFEFVTSVNYTGYFLCVKHACEPMKVQRAHRPDYMADIIEINSKSGLTGSNKNFAYAGSKFGGIGLTQSFALELVEYGIKVNAICPGNLLDGPLWSDPERGLFRQYLDAGKVPGAKSIADVRKFYEDKVPMRRGCTTEDVARALLYLVEQEYETGQALPVTGGQVMLG